MPAILVCEDVESWHPAAREAAEDAHRRPPRRAVGHRRHHLDARGAPARARRARDGCPSRAAARQARDPFLRPRPVPRPRAPRGGGAPDPGTIRGTAGPGDVVPAIPRVLREHPRGGGRGTRGCRSREARRACPPTRSPSPGTSSGRWPMTRSCSCMRSTLRRDCSTGRACSTSSRGRDSIGGRPASRSPRCSPRGSWPRRNASYPGTRACAGGSRSCWGRKRRASRTGSRITSSDSGSGAPTTGRCSSSRSSRKPGGPTTRCGCCRASFDARSTNATSRARAPSPTRPGSSSRGHRTPLAAPCSAWCARPGACARPSSRSGSRRRAAWSASSPGSGAATPGPSSQRKPGWRRPGTTSRSATAPRRWTPSSAASPPPRMRARGARLRSARRRCCWVRRCWPTAVSARRWSTRASRSARRRRPATGSPPCGRDRCSPPAISSRAG